ncbi:MAG: hypothetical protein RL346_501 [Verrucomicrobiota bacterium]|jgi:hypothetical protein
MELSLNDFVLTVLFGSLMLVGLIGAVSRFLHWKSERRLCQRVVECRLCGHVFLNSQHEELVTCEACHAPNRKNGNGKLG